jgi:hypothetical protein
MMHIKLMLQTSHVGDVEKPTTVSDDARCTCGLHAGIGRDVEIPTTVSDDDDSDDEDDASPYAAAILTEAEEKAVRALLGQPLPAPRDSDGRNSRFRVETADGWITVSAMRGNTAANWSHFQVILRSLAMGPVELVFELMRAGNLHLVLSFGPTCTVTISEEQKHHVAEHVLPDVQVCLTPADLQRYLTEKVEVWQRVRPEWFSETTTDLMDDAGDAGRTMQKNRAAGEREFTDLLEAKTDNPDKPYIYVVRGQAYEAIGEKGLAADDYRTAERLLHPEDLMIGAVRRALPRVM